MSIDLKDRVGLHLDEDGWWTLRSGRKSCLIKDNTPDYIIVDIVHKGNTPEHSTIVLLLPLELML